MYFFAKTGYELQHAIDKHSKTLIASNIELFLNYCNRFYDRQFITRDNAHKGILEKFERLPAVLTVIAGPGKPCAQRLSNLQTSLPTFNLSNLPSKPSTSSPQNKKPPRNGWSDNFA
jgi:hypothetical protein